MNKIKLKKWYQYLVHAYFLSIIILIAIAGGYYLTDPEVPQIFSINQLTGLIMFLVILCAVLPFYERVTKEYSKSTVSLEKSDVKE